MTPHAMDPKAPTPRHLPSEAAFWSKVRIDDECWNWCGMRNQSGYGIMKTNGVRAMAHRIAWTFAHGHPGTSCVLHRCDNRLCVRPDHLFLGDPTDNVRDMVAKGRHSFGEDAARAKLTEADVRQIRALRAEGVSWRALGRRFGVTHAAARFAVVGVSWKHIG